MENVRSLFHECGHALHSLLPDTKITWLHSSYADQDFIEMPSILLEYWFLTERHIRGVARHYSYLSPEYREAWLAENPQGRYVPERLDDDLVRRLSKTRLKND